MIFMGEYSAEIIRILISMTLTGSILSVFLFILKPIIKNRLPRSFQHYMWFFVVIALILPVSEIFVIPVSNDAGMRMKSIYDIAQWISDTVSEKPVELVSAPQKENGQSTYQITYLSDTANVLFVGWQSGMIMVLGFHIICYGFYTRRLAGQNMDADRVETELLNTLSERKNILRLYKNAGVNTPILIGFFRPAIIMPDKKYEEKKLRNILLHEVTHKKRHDIFIKWLLIFIGAVHWFNPIVYFVRREMNKACELACDESVIKSFDISEMQQYGDTLIAVAADSIKKMPLSVTMFEAKKNLKERLGAIMNYRKYSRATGITAGILLVTVVCAVLGLSALHGTENKGGYVTYADNDALAQDPKYLKENELIKIIRDYNKENIVLANVYLNYSDGKIAGAYIGIAGLGKNPDSEMLSGLKSLVSEELDLDISNIYLNYTDFESVEYKGKSE